MTNPQMNLQRMSRLRSFIDKLRLRAASLKPHTPAEHKAEKELELRYARAEATLAKLGGEEHLFPRPLISEPIGTHHATRVETDDQRDAIIAFKSRFKIGAKDGGLEPRVCELVFSGVATLSVNEEFNDQHRQQYIGKGYVGAFSFYEVRNSKALNALYKPRVVQLTHWIFYVWRIRVDVIAEQVSLHSGDLRLPLAKNL